MSALRVRLMAVAAQFAPECSRAEAIPYSLTLNGITAFAEVSDAPDLNLTSDWTVELWFKDESPEGYFHLPQVLLTKGNPLVDRQVPYRLVIAFNVLAVGERSGNSGRLLTYDLARHGVSANVWHHVAVTMQSATGTRSLFLDGVRVADRSAPTDMRIGNNRPLTIGRDGTKGFFWRGKLDDIRLWNVVRTPEEIQANYQNELSSSQAGLVSNWQFDEGSGDVAGDNAGGHTARLLGGATFSVDVPQTKPGTPTPTPSPTPSASAGPPSTASPTSTQAATATGTASATPTGTPTVTPTETPTTEPTATPTATPTQAPTETSTPANTPTESPTGTPAQTATPTGTPTFTPTGTPTQTNTPTASPTGTPTPTPTPTGTPTGTATQTVTPIPPTGTPTQAVTATLTPTQALPAATATPSPAPATTPTQPLPPDPGSVAPPLDRSVATDLLTSSQFLYTGATPIQTGVAPGTIDPRRAAVIRGKVLDGSGLALPGAAITILQHPELGQTLSRADGMFDLAVNGGGPLTVQYQKVGLLPSQRQVNVPWQDFAWLPDVVLIPPDPEVTAVDLTAPVSMQVAQSSPMTDQDGTRQATLLFPQGATATMVFPNGSTQSITTLSVRATEYTVGPNGPNAMPAELPPTSAYTYAVDLSADEASAAGASQVRFSTPLPFYVENFLNIEVGANVPLGSYDSARGVWVPAASGRVIKFLSVTNGRADLDTDGDGAADSDTVLNGLGISDAERQQLAALYTPGQSLWRVLIPHFSAWDLNYGFAPQDVPPSDDPSRNRALHAPCTQTGSSVIECQNQILSEALGIVGTSFGLHYLSDRVPGQKVANTLEIPLSGAQLPPGVLRIELEVHVAGQLIQQHFPAQPNQSTTFTWDGKDAYGRTVQGTQPVVVRIGYTYRLLYGYPVTFGDTAGGTVSVNLARLEGTLWHVWQDRIGTFDARAVGLGGWTLSVHHTYDPAQQVLYRGDGRREGGGIAVGPIIRTFAGNGTLNVDNEGGQATAGSVLPAGLGVAADGSVYIAGQFTNVVRRVDPNGIITTVIGDTTSCLSPTAPCGDGGPARQAQVSQPWALATGGDGSVFIAEFGTTRVRRVGPDGIISTIAGTGVAGFSGDGGPGNLAQLGNESLALAVGPDGSVYIADTFNLRIRRVAPDGIISTFAGTGAPCNPRTAACGDGGPATLAQLGSPAGVAAGQDGTIYISDAAGRIRQVTTDGIIRTIAGDGTDGFSGDGGLAAQAVFHNPAAVAVGPDGTVYVVDQNNNRVRWFRPNGPINTLAGTGFVGTTGDGGLASQATLQDISYGLAVGPDGTVYVSQLGDNIRVRAIAPFSGSNIVVPSADGTELYLFTLSGRHLQTVDALTGALRYQFAYDGGGRLATTTDVSGNVTSIERDAAGDPTAILGPFGQRTTLAVNPDGYLDHLTDPAGETVQLAYTTDGLLTRLTTPRGQASTYTFDAAGRLISATDPTGATKTLARSGTNKDYTVTLTSALGRTTSYRVEQLATGDQRLTTTGPSGAQTVAVIGRNGSQNATAPDGTAFNLVLAPDPRWGMRAPVAASVTVTTPGGRVQSTTTQRTVALVNPGDLLNLAALTETVTINGRIFTIAYDATSRTFTQTSPTGRQESAAVDNEGRPMQTQFIGLDPSSYTYDTQGRLATATQGAGVGTRTTSLTYGSAGFLDSITDAIGRTLAFTNDADGRVVAQSFPDGGLARFAYDANGNVAAFTPPGRSDHTFAYTERDQVSTYTAPTVGAESSQTVYTYDADRLPVRVDRPDGQVVQFQYDSAGRLGRVALASGDRSYGYDAAGLLSTRSTPTISLAYAYDGRLLTGTSWSGAIAGSVTRTYDNDFQITSYSVNGSNPIAIQYDADGLPIQVGGLILTRSAQNGLVTATALGAVSDTTTYDGFGAPASYTASLSGSPVYSAVYTRDLLGRISQKIETLGGVTHVTGYTYDPAGQLSEVRKDAVVTASYTYDANGNRLSRSDAGGTITAAYDAQDRLVQYGLTTYVHIANGERVTRTAGAQVTTYAYDGLGNLTAVTLPGGAQVEYVLDASGRRAGKKINGTLVQGFLYQEEDRPIAEMDGVGNVVSRFVYTGVVSVPAYMIKGGATYRIVADDLRSPRLVADVATGQIIQQMDYDEFGNVTLDTNPGFQPFGFGGGLYDQQTGLVHFGAREYDPEIGRWIAKDPIGFAGEDGNLYAYVGNDPVNNVDPAGLCGGTPCLCAREPGLCAAIGEGARRGAEAVQRGAEAVQRGVQAAETAAPAAVNAVENLACRVGPNFTNIIPLQLYGPVDIPSKYSIIVTAIMRLRPEYSLRTAFEVAQRLASSNNDIAFLRQLIASGKLPSILSRYVSR